MPHSRRHAAKLPLRLPAALPGVSLPGAALLLAFLAGCAAAPKPPALSGGERTGFASWYGRPYHGRKTASGEVFDMDALTAAHRTLPFQTNVRVERLDNGRSVEVRINDRGPFVPGRVIDLSRAAARRLRMQRKGVARVRLTPISLPYAPRTRWFVLAGPFAEEEEARRLAGRLAGGARARVLRGWGGEGDSFRLRLGGLTDKEGARALAERMRGEGYGAFLVRGR
ncbi:MAG: septal ring lytic transglycosylase RlpA family protein [bacterium]